MKQYDVVTIGSGPAGLAAAIELEKRGVNHLVIEREGRSGGILKQCIHDGFGLHRFNERLTGPEYAQRFLNEAIDRKITILNNTFVASIEKDDGFILTLVNSDSGVFKIKVKAIILANGCRERTSKQISIHGTRPSGIYTAGTAQYFINIQGYMPFKKCVILGSGDIGLIMARRLTLEGADVLGVYEAKDSPSGLTRNISQCLEDFNIPLHLSRTVTRVYGQDNLERIEIKSVDNNMNPIDGTEEYIDCDTLILSVGLIPENELAKSLNIPLDTKTKGPVVDEKLMTMVDGVFSCGNALHVNDLVDYVSDSGEIAARNAAEYVIENHDYDREFIDVSFNSNDFLYIVPQRVSKESVGDVTFYFRSRKIEENKILKVLCKNKAILEKKFNVIRPPEMEHITLDLNEMQFKNSIKDIVFTLE